MRFQVIRTDYPLEVHAIGCRDLYIRHKRQPLDWKIEGDTVDAAVQAEAEAMNDDFARTYPVHELFRIMNCCGK